MDVIFYILLGFLVGVTIMCAMVIAVSVKDTRCESQETTSAKESTNNKIVYEKRHKDFYTYNSSGKKRKVKNVKYRD